MNRSSPQVAVEEAGVVVAPVAVVAGAGLALASGGQGAELELEPQLRRCDESVHRSSFHRAHRTVR